MSTWKTASLGEIFEIARGGSPRPIQDYLTDDPNGVNWISISDASASSKLITATKKRIRPEGVSRSRMVKPGDFLLTNSMSFGRPYIMGTNGCIHDGWLVLSSKHDDVDQDYFFQLLSSDFIYAKFSKLAAGATVKNLNIDLVSGVEVTFPPLEEQRRIAAILDQAETLRTQRRTALALLDSLTQSLFLDMFGDPVANPKGWPTSPLADASDEIQIGPFGSLLHQEDYVPDGIPLINPMHIKEGQIVPGLDQCITQQKYDELSIYQLKVGDLVMGRRSLSESLCVRHSMSTRSMNATQDEDHRISGQGGAAAILSRAA
ncbi:restriction endonuclease subunit S [Acidovorax sp. JHL-9]|uniref:restriction endonuclease subunit S n=1 Tax=Acidovorax sp. JHL-9 TaxID=1276756 RepID=UPI0004124654|nr:restriction endonuclease subunit S [Acidovorax sp. JHL-9]